MEIVLGIDPGLSHTGWGVLERRARRIQLVSSGVIATDAKMAFPARLARLYHTISSKIAEFTPDVLAIEEAIHAKNTKVALKLGHARGALLLACSQSGAHIVEYAPREIKMAVSGNGNASKEQMQRMVQSVLQLDQKPTPHDVADAIAVALCHIHRARTATHIRAARR